MEFYIGRAMEVCRLSEDQVFLLHEHEKKSLLNLDLNPDGGVDPEKVRTKMIRCLLPFEIQSCFNLHTLKEHYGIPIHEASQAAFAQKLRHTFRVKGLIPEGGDFSVNDLDRIHAFDLAVRSDPMIDLAFQFDGKNMKGADDEKDLKKKAGGDDETVPF